MVQVATAPGDSMPGWHHGQSAVVFLLFCFVFAESAGVTRALEAQREDFKGKQGQGVSLKSLTG